MTNAIEVTGLRKSYGEHEVIAGSARHLINLLNHRGWTGWTKLKRVPPAPARR
ncbi:MULTISPECIES: hypothetical protein [unclassified Kribbella]|uniref:hypothetical protein n=1 Tax=unclassified Kribbella TaxID=2644121 RepID=UPI00301763F8